MQLNKEHLNNITRDFILQENKEPPSIQSYIQVLSEILNNIHPSSKRDSHNISVAKQHLNEIKRYARRLQEENTYLHEQLTILEEEKKK